MSACLSTAAYRNPAASILRLDTRADTGFGAYLLPVAGLAALPYVALAHADPVRVVRYCSSIKRRNLLNRLTICSPTVS